ncbi:MAG: hypothetical protein V1645_01395 [archaeon]
MKRTTKSREAKARLPTVISQPKPGDYLPEAIQKKVLEAGLTHPGTIYPLAFGVGSAAVGLILGSPIFYLLALAGLAGPIWGVVQIFFFPGKISKKYLEYLDQQRNMYKESLKEQLKEGLEENYSSPRAKESARKGIKQFSRVAEALSDIKELLVMKLSTDELLYYRFLAAAEQTYLSVLDTLKDCVALLKSADSIDPEELQSRLTKFERVKDLSSVGQEEKSALDERLKLWQEQMEEVDAMLARNERAMTEMENISSKIAQWQTDKHFALTDIEATISELQNLARFAHNLNNKE